MRYPRNVKIFRGQLDFAPLAGVLFLLVIFLLLGSLISPPGIRIQLASEADLNKSPEKRFISVTRKGEIVYENKTNRIEDLDQLRSQLKSVPEGETVLLQIDSSAPKEVGARVRQMLETSILLASADYLEGTEDRTLVVAINLSGQFFFENELVREDQLPYRLERAKGKSKEPVTLVVFADKSTTDETIFRLGQIAQQAGIHELLLAGHVKKPSATTKVGAKP
jgi:biopolymer transport protein ExbD